MGIGREAREHLRDKDIHQQIKEENANYINQVLYLRGINPQKKNHEHNRKTTTSTKVN